MTTEIKKIAFWAFVSLVVFSLFLNFKHCSDKYDHETIDTVRVTIYDTVTYYQPIPRDSVVKRYETVLLPVADAGRDTNIPICEELETFGEDSTEADVSLPAAPFQDTEPPNDSVAVQIPITQKVYEDSTYKAYVSGYRPQLDSLFIYPKHEEITITKKPKPKRWGIGVHVGYGMTIQGKPEFHPYIGIGISYNLFTF